MIAVRLVSAKTKGDTFGTANLSQLTEKTELWDLVTSNSWELFILKMSADWLALPPTKKLKKFRQTEKELADEALATLSRHLWFLAPSTVLFSLASEKLEDDDKSRIAVKLLQLPKPKETHFGLPTFPKLTEKTELRDLVTSDSWELFNILKLSPDWLAMPPSEWDTSPDYIEFRNFVRTVKVTNDCAERGVKLATDYSKSLTKDSLERSKIYQVVEAERRAKPDTKKSTMNK